MSVADLAAVHPVEPYRWTVEEYLKLGDEGFFRDRRVELLNGQIYEMSPIGYRHAKAVNRFAKRFILLARERYEVCVQSPVILDPHSMPEPDVSLAESVVDELQHHPESKHLYLAIEVADSSLGFDRGEKKESYALRGIPEYWLLNLQENVMEIYREPQGDQYCSVQQLGPSEFASPLAFPDIKLRVGDFIIH